MEVKKINKEELNSFVKKQKHSQFLQSFEWGEFQESAGYQMCRLGLFDDRGILLQAISMIRKQLGAGKQYLYAPRVDIKKVSKEELSFLLNGVKEKSTENKVLFLRLEPRSDFEINNKFIIKKTIDVQPRKTIILDIKKSEEELLSNMRQKTRYNIRLAEKKGVVIRELTADEFDKFWDLINTTKERDDFRIHGKEYYQKMFSVKFIKFLAAEYQGCIIAANIVSFFGDMATYVHGASANRHRNVMAPHLLQWTTIKMAKSGGYDYYDFFGIDQEKWPGVTRFKKGFSGEEVNYPGTFDLVIKPYWYTIYQLARKIRRII